jgi:SAM-dependent methyltransferase
MAIVLHQFHYSHFNEKARWALDYKRLDALGTADVRAASIADDGEQQRRNDMTRRRIRWITFALAAAAAVVALLLLSLPYVPIVHGSEEDEIGRLVEWLGIEPGMVVADLGAGDGRFSLALAARVGPSGRIFATELSPERLEEIRRGAVERGLDNVTVVEGGIARTHLPDDCCDAVFSRNVYHHLTEPAAINADLHRALRSGGRLLVIDFEPGGPMDRISPPETSARHGGHGTPTSTVIDEVTAAGFVRVRGPEPWRGRMYALLFDRVE